uniref:Uncharacterized protein n=1 Tax=Ascaris lumbricoides TaxID=6252 RepID=A0A0M3HRK5_ASCLU
MPLDTMPVNTSVVTNLMLHTWKSTKQRSAVRTCFTNNRPSPTRAYFIDNLTASKKSVMLSPRVFPTER